MWRTLAVFCAVRPMVNMTAAVADEWDRERRQDRERNGTGPTSLSSLLAPTFLHPQARSVSSGTYFRHHQPVSTDRMSVATDKLFRMTGQAPFCSACSLCGPADGKYDCGGCR